MNPRFVQRQLVCHWERHCRTRDAGREEWTGEELRATLQRRAGQDYEHILAAYYPGAALERLY